jgi:thiol:disulfide interchange protein DsbA
MEPRMKNLVFAGLATLLVSSLSLAQAQTPAPAPAPAPEPVAGKDYIEIRNGSPLDSADGKVVVEEFFNYVCPACNLFEPRFAAWKAQLPPYAKVAYIPAAFRADFEPYARAYYAADSLGLVDETHEDVYEAIHVDHTLPGEGEKPDDEKVAEFYAGYGVDADEFLDTMRSFGVNLKVRRATEHMKQSRVTSTPSIVVNGRYLVTASTHADMLRIASYLIDKEHEG